MIRKAFVGLFLVLAFGILLVLPDLAIVSAQNNQQIGVVGPRGYTGARGPAGTITVGTVSTIDPGSAPTFTNVGTANEAQFNVGIPRGSVMYSGSGAPSNLVGGNQDFYFQTDTGCFYGPKVSGAWPGTCTNLRGASGFGSDPNCNTDSNGHLTCKSSNGLTNPVSYGADSTCASDSTAAFNAAILDAGVGVGRAVVVPPGCFRINGEIVLGNGVSLLGAGRNQTKFLFGSNDNTVSNDIFMWGTGGRISGFSFASTYNSGQDITNGSVPFCSASMSGNITTVTVCAAQVTSAFTVGQYVFVSWPYLPLSNWTQIPLGPTGTASGICIWTGIETVTAVDTTTISYGLTKTGYSGNCTAGSASNAAGLGTISISGDRFNSTDTDHRNVIVMDGFHHITKDVTIDNILTDGTPGAGALYGSRVGSAHIGPNVTVRNSIADSISFDMGSHDVTIDTAIVQDGGDDCISFNGYKTGATLPDVENNIVVSSPSVSGCRGQGVFFNGVTNSQLSGGSISHTFGSGFSLQAGNTNTANSSNVTVSGTTFDDTAHGVGYQGGAGVVFIGTPTSATATIDTVKISAITATNSWGNGIAIWGNGTTSGQISKVSISGIVLGGSGGTYTNVDSNAGFRIGNAKTVSITDSKFYNFGMECGTVTGNGSNAEHLSLSNNVDCVSNNALGGHSANLLFNGGGFGFIDYGGIYTKNGANPMTTAVAFGGGDTPVINRTSPLSGDITTITQSTATVPVTTFAGPALQQAPNAGAAIIRAKPLDGTSSSDFIVTDGTNDKAKLTYTGGVSGHAAIRWLAGNLDCFSTDGSFTSLGCSANVVSVDSSGNFGFSTTPTTGKYYWDLNGVAHPNLTKTNIAGTTAGNYIWQKVADGSSQKIYYVYLTGYENTTATPQTFTIATGYAAASGINALSGSCTGVTISGTTVSLPINMVATQTGLCKIEGW